MATVLRKRLDALQTSGFTSRGKTLLGVILSEAKNPFGFDAENREILRCAQNDMNMFPSACSE